MRIAQTCIGRFHHFNVARELYRRNSLAGIITSYPSYKLNNEGIPNDKIKTVPWIFPGYMGLVRYGFGESCIGRELLWRSHELLDYYVSTHLPDAEVLFSLSGSGLQSGRKFQAKGGLYVCDRGSTHILHQERVLRDEFSRWGLTFNHTDCRLRAKEIDEYYAADCITVPTRHCQSTFAAEGVPISKVKVVPYGVDVRDFFPVGSPPNGTFRILFVGQVSLRKGIPYLLEAFDKFRHPKKELIIAGLRKSETDQCFRKFYLKNIHILGHQKLPDLRKLMSMSHVMVLPSIEEGMAIVQGQALACGCPIIASDATGADDLITHGREGFIVPVRSSDALADALTRLADCPEVRNSMSRSALNLVQQIGGWQTYGDQLTSVFNEFIHAQ